MTPTLEDATENQGYSDPGEEKEKNKTISSVNDDNKREDEPGHLKRDDDDDDDDEGEGEVSSPGSESEDERVGNGEDEKVTSAVARGSGGVSATGGVISPAGPMSQLSGRSWLLGRRLPLAGTTSGSGCGQQTTPLSKTKDA